MRIPSEAADEAIRAAADAGVAGVTARSLERWRQVGLIPQTKRHWLGHARGSRSTYAPEQLAHIVQAGRCVPHCRRLEDAVLWLFLNGYPIEQHSVRAAYQCQFDEVGAYLRKSGDDPIDQAGDIANRLRFGHTPGAPAWKRRAKRLTKRPRAIDSGGPEDEPVDMAHEAFFTLALLAIDGDTDIGSTEFVIDLLKMDLPDDLRAAIHAATAAELNDSMKARALRALTRGTQTIPLDRLRQAATMLDFPALPNDTDDKEPETPEVLWFIGTAIFAGFLNEPAVQQALNEDQT